MLTVSIVIYELNASVLKKLLVSLILALKNAGTNIEEIKVSVIDNGDNGPALENLFIDPSVSGPDYQLFLNKENVGYGIGHNQAILTAKSKCHLILNPDVVLHPNCLKEGLAYLEEHPDTAAVSPQAFDESGNRQYLCKEYPSVYLLLLRGFAPGWLRKWNQKKLDEYEMRAITEAGEISDVEIISGCFMLCRTELLHRIGGFDPKYFLYFEDFSLSLELGKLARLVYLPEMSIEHFGGNASGKGWKHIKSFMKSAVIFFNSYGWKVL